MSFSSVLVLTLTQVQNANRKSFLLLLLSWQNNANINLCICLEASTLVQLKEGVSVFRPSYLAWYLEADFFEETLTDQISHMMFFPILICYSLLSWQTQLCYVVYILEFLYQNYLIKSKDSWFCLKRQVSEFKPHLSGNSIAAVTALHLTSNCKLWNFFIKSVLLSFHLICDTPLQEQLGTFLSSKNPISNFWNFYFNIQNLTFSLKW